MSPLRKAIDAAGGVATAAKICEVSPRAIYKWLATGSLPRTEYTGETEHAKRLAAAAAVHGEPFTAEWLLAAAAPGAASSAAVAAEDSVVQQSVSPTLTPEGCCFVMARTPPQKQRGWLNKSEMAASLGISVQAFDKWGVQPVERIGREAFYTAQSVVERGG